MKTIIKENDWLNGISHGWGNGYVLIPQGHPLHGLSYDDIHDTVSISIHGGLTFSDLVDKSIIERWPELSEEDEGYWMVGFDTAHWGDDMELWPREKVQEEAESLKTQLLFYNPL